MLPLTRSRNRARFFGIPFSPEALFAGGTVAGAWYDPSDLSTLFTTSAGTTPVAMPGLGSAVSVGLMLDKSGNGNHAIAFNNTTARPELRARVNLLTYSEEFDNGAWTKSNVTITANAAISPDGTTTADKLIEDNTSNRHFTYQQPTLTSSAYSYTVYAKAAERSWLVIDFTAGANTYCWFNLSNGTLGTVDASRTASISDVGNGWYRCTVTAASISGGVFTATFVSTGNNVVTYTGDGTSGIFIWGADLRPANIGANVPAYQRIADANTYDTSGFPLYLFFDGIDDSMYTPANLNLSGTDKATVFAGVRRLANTDGCVTELTFGTTNGLGLFAATIGGNSWFFSAFGTNQLYGTVAPYGAPITNVLTEQLDKAALTDATRISARVNAVAVSLSYFGNLGVSGNFANAPLYIGSRANSAFWLNGHLYSLIIAGSAVSAGNISATEQWVANKTGIVIP